MTNPPLSPGDAFSMISANVQRVVQGKPGLVRMAVAGIFAEGHLLIEDVPGLGKTTLARCLAASVDASFHRIQFTPDLLPGDITGGQVFLQRAEEFVFQRGAVFANFVMADEINRGTPKTQSALLEVMAEGSVTVGGEQHRVPEPFMVIATQNPIELEGTYRLPEAQLDRFLMRLSVDYPDRDAEIRVVLGDNQGVTPAMLRPVLTLDQVSAVIEAVRAVHVQPDLCGYAVDLAAATRAHPLVRYGASPRGSVAIVRAARAWAATAGRSWVTPDDIKDVAHAVLDHRVIVRPEAELAQRTPASIVDDVLLSVDMPGSDVGAPVRVRLTRRGTGVLVAAALCFAVGEVLGHTVPKVVAGSALAAVVVGVLLCLRGLPIKVSRDVTPDRVRRGDPAAATLTVVNPTGRPSPDFLTQDPPVPDDIAISGLAAGGSKSYSYRLPTGRRGRVSVGPLTLKRADLLGLVSARTTTGEMSTLWVHPRTQSVRVRPGAHPRHHHEGAATDPPMRGSIDLREVREYVVGDEPRHIHWRATARTGQLMVRDFVDPAQPRFTVLLDTGTASLRPDEFEVAVDVAASLATAAALDGHRTRLVTTGGLDIDTLGGVTAARDLLDALCEVEQTPGRLAARATVTEPGTVLAFVTGAAAATDAAAIAAMRRRAAKVVVIDVGAEHVGRIPAGAITIRATDAARALATWTRTVAS